MENDRYATVEEIIKELSEYPKDYFVTVHDYDPTIMILKKSETYTQVGEVVVGRGDN